MLKVANLPHKSEMEVVAFTYDGGDGQGMVMMSDDLVELESI